jgi:hypothetical protein
MMDILWPNSYAGVSKYSRQTIEMVPAGCKHP